MSAEEVARVQAIVAESDDPSYWFRASKDGNREAHYRGECMQSIAIGDALRQQCLSDHLSALLAPVPMVSWCCCFVTLLNAVSDSSATVVRASLCIISKPGWLLCREAHWCDPRLRPRLWNSFTNQAWRRWYDREISAVVYLGLSLQG